MELEQIFEYAIDQEMKAKEFYEKSAASIDNVTAQILFRNLAKMEVGHKRALENELNILRKTGDVKHRAIKTVPPQDEMLSSLYNMTRVLREANVELETREKRIKTELDMAGQIQLSLLPKKAPMLPGMDISVACFMARQVGGDFYDFLINPIGELCFTLGDVSGKGVPASLLMVAMRTLWRSSVRDGNTANQTLEALSEDAAAELSQSDQFVTMLSGIYNPVSSIFNFSNAGHWPPLVLQSGNDTFDPIPPGFMPIGIETEPNYETIELELKPGDIVVFFSDGLVEAKNEKRIEFGEERVMDIILKNRIRTAKEIQEKLIHEVDGYSSGTREDDLTLMVFKRV